MREDMAWVRMKLLQRRSVVSSRRVAVEQRKRAYDSTRASEVSPAMAIPMWSSMRMSFFW